MPRKLVVLVILVAFSSLISHPIKADELSDLQNQINKKNTQLVNNLNTIERLKKDISNLSSSIPGTAAELEKARAQAVSVGQELVKAEQDLEKRREILNYLVSVRDKQIRAIYQNPQRTPLELMLTDTLVGFTENLSYQTNVFNDSRKLVKTVNEEVLAMEKTQKTLQDSKVELENLVAALDARYTNQKQSLAAAASRQASLSKGLDLIKSDVTRALIRKAELDEQRRGNFSGAPPVPYSPGPPGTAYYFFYGIGRYSFMGHGVGMSQYGAEGYARKGWNYKDILRKYYTGVSVSDYTGSRPDQGGVYNDSTWRINVQGYGQMTYEQYLSGIGEIPSSWNWNINSYAALITSARTYALRYTGGDPNVAICTNSQCQVYSGGNAKAQAVAISRNQAVLAPGGSLATTLYSADHGGHSENNENVFQGWNGNGYQGYPASYLRGVSDADSGFSFPNMGYSDWVHWAWNTKYSYTLPQIREILRRQGLTSAENAWIDNKVGTLTGLGIERGVSGRVAWVVLYGTKGTAKIPGMVFRASFNSLPSSGPPANGDDAMFSVNFSIGNQVK